MQNFGNISLFAYASPITPNKFSTISNICVCNGIFQNQQKIWLRGRYFWNQIKIWSRDVIFQIHRGIWASSRFAENPFVEKLLSANPSRFADLFFGESTYAVFCPIFFFFYSNQESLSNSDRASMRATATCHYIAPRFRYGKQRKL